MTSLVLLSWIALGILLQLALFLGVSFYRHWGRFQQLKSQAAVPDAGVEAAPAPVSAWPGLRAFRVSRKESECADGAVCSFHLTPEDGHPLPPFLPGQFLTFQLEVPAGTGTTEQVVRCYSLSDAPRPDRYRVSIKRVAAPAGQDHLPAGRSSNYFHDQVNVGSRLQVRAPAGHFFLDDGTGPVVLIAGGIGITPMLSMLHWSLAAQPGRELWLFYGVRNSRDHAMKADLEALARANKNLRLFVCYSAALPEDEVGRDYGHAGRVDVDLLRLHLPLQPYHFYICGPAPMMASLVSGLEDWGVPDARIHFEAFGPASVKRKAAAPAESATARSDIVVTFAKSGRQIPWQPEAGSLLEFAERNDIAVDSGCRAGGCGSCQTTIAAGEVAYRQPPDFDPQPGTCLMCVCMPKTSVTLEA